MYFHDHVHMDFIVFTYGVLNDAHDLIEADTYFCQYEEETKRGHSEPVQVQSPKISTKLNDCMWTA